ncbi:hypothetical protein MBANPS3_006011 [Mucor bainieri]
MDPYHPHHHYASQPPLPAAAAVGTALPLTPHPLSVSSYHHSYPGMNPYSAPPYSTISSEYMSMPHHQQQQMYMTPPLIHPQLIGGGAAAAPHYYVEESSLWSSFLETCCCCFGYGPPQTPFEAMHRQEMERRRIIAKEEKYRRSQYEKALRQENRRLSLAQSAKASSDQAKTAANTAATQANTIANAATGAAASNSN